MDRDGETVDEDWLRHFRRQRAHIGRRLEALGYFRGSIVVAADQIDGDVSVTQSAHLLVEEQASAVVRPVAIVEVASDE